jgi:hypothetical protein
MNIDNTYHDMVGDEIQIINDIVAHESIEETNDFIFEDGCKKSSFQRFWHSSLLKELVSYKK